MDLVQTSCSSDSNDHPTSHWYNYHCGDYPEAQGEIR